MGKFFKAFIITLLLIVIFFFGIIGYFLLKSHIENPEDFFNELVQADNKLTFLLLGVDNLDVKNAQNTRSDTIMIVNMNLESGKVDIVSIPRDTYAGVEGYKKQKINHFFNYGGSELTLQAVNSLLGTNIEYYMTIDYKFVQEIVDTIGGVHVNVPVDMVYSDPYADPPLEINIPAGPQTLNGENSIKFLRFRKGYKDGSDLSRVESQQQFVSAFIQKIKKPESLIKAPLIMKSYDKYTLSNIPFSKIVKSGLNVGKFSSENITMQTLPGVADYKNEISYFFMNEKQTDELLSGMGLK